jgi:hypothetical protein
MPALGVKRLCQYLQPSTHHVSIKPDIAVAVGYPPTSSRENDGVVAPIATPPVIDRVRVVAFSPPAYHIDVSAAD